MSFITLEFLILFFATTIFYHLSRTEKKKQMVLLAASYIFYAYWDIRFLGLLLMLTLVVYRLAIKVSESQERKRERIYCIIGVIVSLGILAFFKYFNFFFSIVKKTFNCESDKALYIILPVGISFYTFQAISYLVDVYREEIEARRSFQQVALYIAFFPQLVAGPIVRASDFLPQMDKEHKIRLENVEKAIQIFLFGLFKKVVIADRLAVCVDAVFATPTVYDSLSIMFAVIAYSMQIYCDFSGYSDMAIGIAKFFGYELPENFNMPYISKNPTEFWNRWHISLSRWLRDYLYIPLGGNRRGKIRTYINLVITMLLGGLWHGASWNFVLWGGLNGALLVIHKIFVSIKKKYNLECRNQIVHKMANVVSILATYSVICIGWVFFRTQNLSDAVVVLQRIFMSSNGIHYVYSYTIVFGILFLMAHLYGIAKNGGHGRYMLFDLSGFRGKVVVCLMILVICVFSYGGDSAFVYFQF